MHGLLVTFTSTADIGDLVKPFTDYANAMRTVPGLVFKTWIRDGATLGGFHVFEDRAAAEAYLAGDMVAGLTSNPAFSDFEIRHYEVLGELSSITRTPRLMAV